MTFCICMISSEAQVIILDPQHLLYAEFQMFQSEQRFSLPKEAQVDSGCRFLHLLLFSKTFEPFFSMIHGKVENIWFMGFVLQ